MDDDDSIPGVTEIKTERVIWTDRRLTIVLLIVVVLVGGFETVRFVNSVNARHKIDTSATILQKVDETATVIKRATSPEAQARAAAAYAAAVGSINDTTEAAVFCGNKGGDLPSIRECVTTELAKLREQHTAASLP